MAILNVARSGGGMFEGGVWIFYVEALLALALGLFIVWWTLPKKKRPDETPRSEANPERPPGAEPRRD